MISDRIRAIHGDSREVLKTLADCSVDSVVCDPPYALTSTIERWSKTPRTESTMPKAPVYARTTAGFMGQKWDTGETAHDPEFWREVYRVLKPGAHVVAFAGTRTYHRLAAAIEDAGFEIRDMVSWLFGSGFPKSHDVSKAIDRANGAERVIVGRNPNWRDPSRNAEHHERWNDASIPSDITAPATDSARQWQGWGTALKPALEPICVARKPLIGTVAANVLQFGTGAINIDGCRVAHCGADDLAASQAKNPGRSDTVTSGVYGANRPQQSVNVSGRWPANVLHDGSEEVVGAFPETHAAGTCSARNGTTWSGKSGDLQDIAIPNDAGSAARFFYSAKADVDDRLGSKHPTVKPIDLMQYLIRLVTPKGGLVLDPFAGTGTTGEAAFREGCRALLIEREAQYFADIQRRTKLLLAGPDERQRESIKASGKVQDAGPLFA